MKARIGSARWAGLFLLVVVVAGFTTDGAAQNGPLQRFRNYFVTGDYVVAGWEKSTNDGQFSKGMITVPDTKEAASGLPMTVPVGADIVAAYLYWETVESSKTTFAGQGGYFNGVQITGFVLGNPNSPSSWSAGGCAGDNSGAKTIRAYRADVRPYLNLNSTSGAIGFGPGPFQYEVRLADTGANQQPYTLGATLVIVYRILSPSFPQPNQTNVPLNAIAIFDGSYNPSNTSSTMQESIDGFYEAVGSPNGTAKLTHIVGNGQGNKLESVYLNDLNNALPPLWALNQTTAFPGAYNNSWDNPTWVVSDKVGAEQSSATTTIIPNSSNKGCVTWGAVIMSTTVPDQDNDGLLDTWEDHEGYIDAGSQHWVPLPGAHKTIPDIFVELDYLSDLGSNFITGTTAHTHLPKQAALDKVGGAFSQQGISIHFDVGNAYQTQIGGTGTDPYIIPYVAPDPTTGNGSGSTEIPESATICKDSDAGLCPYPSTPTVGWKEGFFYLQNNATVPNSNPPIPLGGFAPERAAAYHYVLSAHALGEPQSVWSAVNANPQAQSAPYLKSIANIGDGTGTVKVTLVSTSGMAKPGDCKKSTNPGCTLNFDRIIVTGAIAQPKLNGIYKFSSVNVPTPADPNTTTFVIPIAGLPSTPAVYDYSNEPQLAVMYGGPTTSSGHSDIAGGDTIITFGLWPGDNPTGCASNPTLANPPAVPYCDDQVGTVQAQAGTLMHEIGHTLGLTHGGTYYSTANNYDIAQTNPSSVPSYGLNCKSNFLSVMNYLFQVHGFPESADIDFSPKTLNTLSEDQLSESLGIGTDASAHLTRWYALPGPLDTMLGTSLATMHCDGTPLPKDDNGNIIGPRPLRVDGQSYGTSPNPVDWNNDLVIHDPVGTLDVNFDASTQDPPNLGVDEWAPDMVSVQGGAPLYTIGVDLRQVDARQNSAGLSGAAGTPSGIIGGGGSPSGLTGGGGTPSGIIGGGGSPSGLTGGGGTPSGIIGGGGIELDLTAANSVVDAPYGLSTMWNKSLNAVDLTWSQPVFGRVRAYYIYRLLGTVSATNPLTNATLIATLTGTPPVTKYSDRKASINKTYTYFVVSQIDDKRKSGKSNLGLYPPPQ